ncbi:MAG TPA: hypothetical protein VGR15_10180, partial [Bacteroidota bacterium]|nr:hypothetical protein [Bacteroidota bacterium]
DCVSASIAEQNSRRVLREQNSILRLELIKPHNKAIAVANTFTGLNQDDIYGFRYVVWPYVKNSLWNIDGRI